MGLVPGLYLLGRYFAADRTHEWFADQYLYGVALFLALAGTGASWGLLEMRRWNRPGRPHVINE